jgi:chromosome segregation ATPase
MGDKIIRYQFDRQCNCMCDVIADKEGEFVGYDDYEALQAECNQFSETWDKQQASIKSLQAKLAEAERWDEIESRVNERLQAEVERYRDAIQATIDDLLIRGEVDSQGCRVVNLSASTWEKLNDSLEPTEKE